MRAPRLISLLLILQNHGHRTAAELAEELGVSVRTIYRDLLALSVAGVPVVAERGPGGGCRLMGGYRTNLTGLSPGEADALFLSGAPAAAAELGLGGLLAAAQRKLLAALPPRLREAALLAEQRFHLDATSWFDEPPAQPELERLATAVWGDRRVAFEYTRDRLGPGEPPVEREGEPLALVQKSGLWYLVARVGGDVRTYRVSRIARVRVLDVGFARDPHFELRAYWDDAVVRFTTGLPAYPVVVRVSPRARERLERLGDPYRRAGPSPAIAEPDGWTRHTLVFEKPMYARSHLLDFAGELEVLEPDELRAELLRAALEAAAMYGGASAATPVAPATSRRASRRARPAPPVSPGS